MAVCTFFPHIKYINSLKIERAKELIHSDIYSLLEDIALSSGFLDSCYFGKVFKTEPLMSQNAYKKNIAKQIICPFYCTLNVLLFSCKAKSLKKMCNKEDFIMSISLMLLLTAFTCYIGKDCLKSEGKR